MSSISRIHKRVTVKEAKELLLITELRIYDLRDEESFAQGHMERAVCLSWRDLERVVLGSPKEIPILIYCYQGNVSQIAAQTFQDFGFREVYDLVGGYQRWNDQSSSPSKKKPSTTLNRREQGHGHSSTS